MKKILQEMIKLITIMIKYPWLVIYINLNQDKFEENKEISDFETNKKFRNTMTGLNKDKMKYQNGLIDMILNKEKDNINHYLWGDLGEMNKNINRDNY